MAEAASARRLSLRRIVADTVDGTFQHGFTHAGNLAYLSLVTLFPFVILLASIAGRLGRTADGLAAVNGFLNALPQGVTAIIAPAIRDVVAAPATGGVVTFGLIVALWTSSGVLVTLRTIVQQAYGTPSEMPFWRWRLIGLAEVLALVILLLLAFAAQVVVTGAETFVYRLMPMAANVFPALGLQRIVPALLLFLALWSLFSVLCPRRFRVAPSWPGALATAAAWTATTLALPRALTLFNDYALTYGSLAGVIIALLYFYIIGLGLVLGAQLNAAVGRARLEIAAIAH
ncbi:YhjD/YihY/BrkB family envelope integrity protein [Sandarakinorhabdus sp. AAP62]|uniref:YihY/virulence factor BrkB family protein n=1 Tax=Sandarakinorhabdus sp. AAP62 TaxID=1248916 RepID=UPI0002E602CB|nr:YhjD/YihY/BrkB family envelope integrity protein [Sandarakinorhabdus sp. AAP62]